MNVIKPMLAKTLNEKHLKFPCLVQPKFDGVRALFHKKHFYSRDSHLWQDNILEHIIKELGSLLPDSVTFDGELYVHGWPLNRINSAIAINRKEISKDTQYVEYHVYDYYDSNMQDSNLVRAQAIQNFFDANRFRFVKQVMSYVVTSKQLLEAVYEQTLKEGYEGVIIREPKAMYKPDKRTYSLMKYKPWKYIMAKVVGIKEGKDTMIGSKYKDSVGSLQVIADIDGNKVEFDVGSGLTDYQRDDFWKNPGKIIGKQIKIKFERLSAYGIPLKPTIETIAD